MNARAHRPAWLLSLLSLALCGPSACLTPDADPDVAGIYACVTSIDCPGEQSCLQGTCEAIELPELMILNPEDGDSLPHQGGVEHTINISINATNFTLRPLAESSEPVPGEGHLAVFVDELLVDMIDEGDLGAGVLLSTTVADVPGVHRVRVQARLNDGRDYDNPEASPRTLIWVDDGRQHVAFRRPWPGDRFDLDAQEVETEVAVFGGLSIDAPESGAEHVHVYYDKLFPACLDDDQCEDGHSGVVPSQQDTLGPMIFPAATASTVTLTALVRNSDHSRYLDAQGEAVWSQIEILRAD